MPGQTTHLRIPSDDVLLRIFAGVLIACCGISVLLESPIPVLLPLGAVFILYALNAPKQLYFLFFFLLPFSVEIQLPGGFATDLPSEPIMIVLMGLSFLYVIRHVRQADFSFLRHPVSLLLIVHVFWILFTALLSTSPLISFKYLLAKSWYLIPFYVFPFLFFNNEKDFRRLFQFLFVGLFLAITFVMIQHSQKAFSFASINDAVKPIFRNHVNYAIMLVALLPYFWYLIKSSSAKWKWPMVFLMCYLLLSIYLTYTRAAQITALATIAIYFTVKWRLIKHALVAGVIFMTFMVTFLSYNNKYLDFAPDYEKAIAHYSFDDIVSATYKMQDISTVERFYRWIAGFYMVKEKPLIGYGPSTFYSQYHAHTVNSYRTYVSDNPEKSGIHNNYLMVAVEQGIPGLLIMIGIAFLPLIFAEKAYHLLKDPSEKTLVMAAAISYAVIDIVILINDLLEADKVGPFYFLSAAIIVYYYRKAKREN
jgi:hypothetical protein